MGFHYSAPRPHRSQLECSYYVSWTRATFRFYQDWGGGREDRMTRRPPTLSPPQRKKSSNSFWHIGLETVQPGLEQGGRGFEEEKCRLGERNENPEVTKWDESVSRAVPAHPSPLWCPQLRLMGVAAWVPLPPQRGRASSLAPGPSACSPGPPLRGAQRAVPDGADFGTCRRNPGLASAPGGGRAMGMAGEEYSWQSPRRRGWDRPGRVGTGCLGSVPCAL